jgi:hypothetical protein
MVALYRESTTWRCLTVYEREDPCRLKQHPMSKGDGKRRDYDRRVIADETRKPSQE